MVSIVSMAAAGADTPAVRSSAAARPPTRLAGCGRRTARRGAVADGIAVGVPFASGGIGFSSPGGDGPAGGLMGHGVDRNMRGIPTISAIAFGR